MVESHSNIERVSELRHATTSRHKTSRAVAARIPIAQADQLRALADQNGTTINQIVGSLIANSLDRNEEPTA